MKRRIVAVAVALVLALVGAGLVVVYVNGADARAVESQHPVTAYVVKKLVPAGTSLATAKSEGLISATRVTESGRPAGALTAVDATNRSLVATTDIQPGEFVMMHYRPREILGNVALNFVNFTVLLNGG